VRTSDTLLCERPIFHVFWIAGESETVVKEEILDELDKNSPEKLDAAKTIVKTSSRIVEIADDETPEVKKSISVDLKRDFMCSPDHEKRFDCLFCPMYTAGSKALREHLFSRHNSKMQRILL
jgi:hypothetical protein